MFTEPVPKQLYRYWLDLMGFSYDFSRAGTLDFQAGPMDVLRKRFCVATRHRADVLIPCHLNLTRN